MTWLEAHLMQNTDSEIHADQNARAGVGGGGTGQTDGQGHMYTEASPPSSHLNAHRSYYVKRPSHSAKDNQTFNYLM